MEILDTTIVNVALPHIAGSLSTSNDEASWALTSYLVANGIVLTISGWLSAVIGRKRYFLICLSMFTVCSLLCGIANSLSQLIVFRLLQGFFGGGLQPGQQSIILDTFPPEKRGGAFGVTAIATVVAPVLGPTARQALGYKEVLAHLERGEDLEACVAETVRRTRELGRRQRAWFRRDPRIRWHGTRVDPAQLLTGLGQELDRVRGG